MVTLKRVVEAEANQDIIGILSKQTFRTHISGVDYITYEDIFLSDKFIDILEDTFLGREEFGVPVHVKRAKEKSRPIASLEKLLGELKSGASHSYSTSIYSYREPEEGIEPVDYELSFEYNYKDFSISFEMYPNYSNRANIASDDTDKFSEEYLSSLEKQFKKDLASFKRKVESRLPKLQVKLEEIIKKNIDDIEDALSEYKEEKEKGKYSKYKLTGDSDDFYLDLSCPFVLSRVKEELGEIQRSIFTWLWENNDNDSDSEIDDSLSFSLDITDPNGNTLTFSYVVKITGEDTRWGRGYGPDEEVGGDLSVDMEVELEDVDVTDGEMSDETIKELRDIMDDLDIPSYIDGHAEDSL